MPPMLEPVTARTTAGPAAAVQDAPDELAKRYLTPRPFRQMLGRIDRFARHPTRARAHGLSARKSARRSGEDTARRDGRLTDPDT
jgi:hypothetical protein